MSIRTLSILFIAFISLASFEKKIQQTGNEWVYEQEKKGIKIFTKKSKWGNLRDSRAVMQVAATPEEMYKLLTDFDHYSTWMNRCSKSRLVARLSDNEFIAHLHFESPWPVKDRDCVVRVKVVKDANGVITITQTSEPKYIKEEDDAVRIVQLNSIWRLTPKNGGTEIVNEYGTNPGGNIPDWMVNTQSVEYPQATFEGLQIKATSKKGR